MLKLRLISGVILTCLLAAALPAFAHEFWLQAQDYTLETGQKLRVEIRVGQDFKGNEYSFNPEQFTEFALTDGHGKTPVEGRIGDMPAVEIIPENDGLIVLNHFSTSQRLIYQDAEKFEDFLESKGLDWVLAKHRERGLPAVGFKEGYTRFAKSLIAVNGGAGQDAATGMHFELVALANPYTDDMTDGLPVQLLWQGQGLADIQIDIFHKSDSIETTKIHVKTDAEGRAVIPVHMPGEYLVNAVHMIIPFAEDIERTGTVWHSLWASLTFEIINP
ncbi:MAG: DUF4198 domain-containing protein [Paracoccaceae bacterium]